MVKKEEALVVNGTVIDAFANAQFRVRLDQGIEVQAHLSGNIRRHRIRVVSGDEVEVELSSYDLQKGRIIYRKR